MGDLIKLSDVQSLEEMILAAPQVELNTTHALSGGMYARTIFIPAGTVLTGATHKTDHLNIVCGDISVTTDEGMRRMTGYHVLTTKSGMKRAGFAHADTMWTTVCKTDQIELEAIENELVEEADKLQTRKLQITSNDTKRIEE